MKKSIRNEDYRGSEGVARSRPWLIEPSHMVTQAAFSIRKPSKKCYDRRMINIVLFLRTTQSFRLI